MEKINFCEGVVAQMMESEAWQELSCSINWNETQLEKYADKLDWEKVSRNENMLWTNSMLEKFKNRINWRALSESIRPKSFSPALLDKYADKWDWSAISESSELTPDFVEKYADRLNWSRVIDNWHFCDDYGTEAFLKKYQDRIPSGQFHDSNLWRSLLARKQDEILSQISME